MNLKAEISDESTNNIIGANTGHMSEAAKARLPKLDSIRRGIRRARAEGNPIAPHRNDQNFDIPEELKFLNNGELFLQFNKMIIMISTVTECLFLEREKV